MKNRPAGFTLLEIMIVLLIFAIITAIAVPAWMRAREHSRGRACQENLTKIDGAKEVYAMEYNLRDGTDVLMSDLVSRESGYLKITPYCPAGGEYIIQPIGTLPSCTYYGRELYNAPPHKLPVP